MMEKIDFNRIRKMAPDRKVKALQEVQEELNTFITEKNKEIQESQNEINDAQDFLREAEEELQVLEEMQSEAPKIKEVNVKKLFEPAKEKVLEDIAEQEGPKTAPASIDQQAYISKMARQPVATIYEKINTIRDQIKTTGIVSQYQQERLEQFREALQEKEEAIHEGRYSAGRNTANLLTAAEKAIAYTTHKTGDRDFYRTRHDA